MSALNPYQRGSRVGAMMPLLIAAALMPQRTNDRGVLPWPKSDPYDAEKQKRNSEERLQAARLKRERKALKRANINPPTP